MTDTALNKQDGDHRRRLRELLAVPERDRSDAQWDEIAELELRLAPGNRIEPARRGEPPSALPPPRQPSKRHPPVRPTGKKARKPNR
jgi:hypothetical protein